MSTDEKDVLLTSEQQYTSEVMALHRLSDEETIIERARNGDSAARQALIESCLPYILKVARRYTLLMPSPADDFMELVCVGNLTIMNRFDYALYNAREVTPYLCG